MNLWHKLLTDALRQEKTSSGKNKADNQREWYLPSWLASLLWEASQEKKMIEDEKEWKIHAVLLFYLWRLFLLFLLILLLGRLTSSSRLPVLTSGRLVLSLNCWNNSKNKLSTRKNTVLTLRESSVLTAASISSLGFLSAFNCLTNSPWAATLAPSSPPDTGWLSLLLIANISVNFSSFRGTF